MEQQKLTLNCQLLMSAVNQENVYFKSQVWKAFFKGSDQLGQMLMTHKDEDQGHTTRYDNRKIPMTSTS